jgi:hypothetical protein
MGWVKRTFTWRTFLTVPCGEKDSTLDACWPEAAETKKNKEQRLNQRHLFMIASCKEPKRCYAFDYRKKQDGGQHERYICCPMR